MVLNFHKNLKTRFILFILRKIDKPKKMSGIIIALLFSHYKIPVSEILKVKTQLNVECLSATICFDCFDLELFLR